MGFHPQCEGITIDFDCQFKVHLKDSRISTILAAFTEYFFYQSTSPWPTVIYRERADVGVLPAPPVAGF